MIEIHLHLLIFCSVSKNPDTCVTQMPLSRKLCWNCIQSCWALVDFILSNCIYISMFSSALFLIHKYTSMIHLLSKDLIKNSTGKYRWLVNYLNRKWTMDLCFEMCIVRWIDNRVLTRIGTPEGKLNMWVSCHICMVHDWINYFVLVHGYNWSTWNQECLMLDQN